METSLAHISKIKFSSHDFIDYKNLSETGINKRYLTKLKNVKLIVKFYAFFPVCANGCKIFFILNILKILKYFYNQTLLFFKKYH